MKKVLLLFLVGFALSLAACGQNQKNNRSIGRANGVANYVPNQVAQLATGSVGQWAQIQGYTQAEVVDFVSTGLTQNQIGNTLGCTDLNGDPCQVDFNVSVNPLATNFSPIAVSMGGQGQFQAASAGVLTIAIYDSLTGNGISPIAAAIPLVSATMSDSGSSGQATLTFQDNSGAVVIAGYISGEVFAGQIMFSVNNDVNTGVSIPQEYLGPSGQNQAAFETNICYMFQCSNY